MNKKLIIGIIGIVVFILSLTSCTTQADEPDPTPSATQTQPVETPEPEETAPQVEPLSVTHREPTPEEIEGFFEYSYDVGKICAEYGGTEEEVLEAELSDLKSKQEMNSDFLTFPEDYEIQYLKWRVLHEASNETPPQETPSTAPQTQPVQPVSGGGSTNTQKPNTGGTQTGGGPTIVDDWGNPIQGGTTGNYTPDSGGRIDVDNTPTLQEQGYAPIDPSNIIYGN